MATSTVPQRAYISDIVIGLQLDRCAEDACPRIYLLIDIDHSPSELVRVSPEALKKFIRAFGKHLSKWFGQQLQVCYQLTTTGKRQLLITPVNQ